MLGWLLYKKTEDVLKPEVYEIRRLVETAEKLGITIRVLSPDQIDIIVFLEDRNSILVDEVPTRLPDFILPRMGSGTSYFVKFPVVVKTLSGTQGMGIFLSTDQDSFEDLMQLIHATNKSANIILQEFIEFSKGRDLRVFVIGGRVVGAMERTARQGSFKANCSIGGTARSFVTTRAIENLAIEISRILNLEVAGIDLLFDRTGFKICEVNSAPGFEAMESFCGLNIAGEILAHITRRNHEKGV